MMWRRKARQPRQGIRANDVIISVNDKPAVSALETMDQVAEIRPGSEIPVVIMRDDKKLRCISPYRNILRPTNRLPERGALFNQQNRPGREFRQKPGDGQQRPQPRPGKLPLPQLVIERHQRKFAVITQYAALPEQPLSLLPRQGDSLFQASRCSSDCCRQMP